MEVVYLEGCVTVATVDCGPDLSESLMLSMVSALLPVFRQDLGDVPDFDI